MGAFCEIFAQCLCGSGLGVWVLLGFCGAVCADLLYCGMCLRLVDLVYSYCLVLVLFIYSFLSCVVWHFCRGTKTGWGLAWVVLLGTSFAGLYFVGLTCGVG